MNAEANQSNSPDKDQAQPAPSPTPEPGPLSTPKPDSSVPPEQKEPDDPDKVAGDAEDGASTNNRIDQQGGHNFAYIDSSTYTTINNNLGGIDWTNLSQRLRTIGRLPPYQPYANDELVARWTQALLDNRLLILAYGKEGPKSALYSILGKLRDKHPSLKQVTCLESQPLPLPLHNFLHERVWTDAAIGNSIIYLDRSREPDDFNHEFVENLYQYLEKFNSRLLLVTSWSSIAARATAHSVLAQAELATWRLEPPLPQEQEQRTATDLREHFSDGVGLVLIAVAALFPGMPLAEYLNLCTNLLPQDAPGPSMDAQKPAPPTNLERWRRGEHDALMGTFGVTFGPLPSLITDAASPVTGCHLREFDLSLGVSDQLFRTQPAFMVKQLAPMTELYLVGRGSQAFNAGYLRYIVHLNISHIQPISTEWLMQCYNKVVSAADALNPAQRLLELLYHLLEQPFGPSLIREYLQTLGARCVTEESAWHETLISAGYEKILQGLPEDSTYRIHEQVIEGMGLKNRYLSLCYQAELLQLVVLTLMAHPLTGNAAAEVCALTLAGSPSRSNWRQLAAEQPALIDVVAVSRFCVARRFRLLSASPSHLIKVFEAVTSLLPPATDSAVTSAGEFGRAFGNREERQSWAREALMRNCISLVQSMVDVGMEKGFDQDTTNALFAGDQTTRSGKLVAALIAGHKACKSPKPSAIPAPELFTTLNSAVRIYERFCRSLLADKSLAVEAKPRAIAFIAPLRDYLDGRQYQALILRARHLSEGYQLRRDYFSKYGNRDKEKIEGMRIRAADLLVRALCTRVTEPVQEGSGNE